MRYASIAFDDVCVHRVFCFSCRRGSDGSRDDAVGGLVGPLLKEQCWAGLDILCRYIERRAAAQPEPRTYELLMEGRSAAGDA